MNFVKFLRTPFLTERLRWLSQKLDLHFFLIFCMKLDSHKVGKVTKLNFWKKSQKCGFCGFDKSLVHLYVLFLLGRQITYGILTFCKICMGGKNLVSWVMAQKPLDQSELSILSTTISHKRVEAWSWILCMWLDIHRSNKFTQLFEVGVVRHAWACPKLCQIMSQLHLRDELSDKDSFLYLVRNP